MAAAAAAEQPLRWPTICRLLPRRPPSAADGSGSAAAADGWRTARGWAAPVAAAAAADAAAARSPAQRRRPRSLLAWRRQRRRRLWRRQRRTQTQTTLTTTSRWTVVRPGQCAYSLRCRSICPRNKTNNVTHEFAQFTLHRFAIGWWGVDYRTDIVTLYTMYSNKRSQLLAGWLSSDSTLALLAPGGFGHTTATGAGHRRFDKQPHEQPAAEACSKRCRATLETANNRTHTHLLPCMQRQRETMQSVQRF